MRKNNWLIILFISLSSAGFCQIIDTSKKNYLSEVILIGNNSKTDILHLPHISGTEIFAGKKNSLVIIDKVNGNIATNTMRQIVAKVPGVHIWESDGSGIQIGIAGRGLSPNRSWEYNVRQNGYDIAADPFGYPEAYYTPQLQAVQSIQFVKGAGALQYGPQFGGLVNFIMKNGSEINKPFQFESQNTIGSFGLVNTYHSMGGEKNNFHYFSFFNHRNADGWRENSKYKVQTGFASAYYKINNYFKVGIEYTNWQMKSQQPGGLNDSSFNADAKQSIRSRNWLNVKWNILAITGDYQLNEKNKILLKLFTVQGNRGSVGFTKAINIIDSINNTTQQQLPRTVDIDQYRNYGSEMRYLTHYNIGKIKNSLSAGIRFFVGKTNRFKNGVGTNGNDNNETIIGKFDQIFELNTINTALFAENVFNLSDKFSIVPGIRYEFLSTKATGTFGNNSSAISNQMKSETRKRHFIVLGIGAEFHVGKETEIYANYTQAYRPMLFSDLTASPTTDIVDPNLKDSRGFNADLGYRGRIRNYLFFDASIFFMAYNNRIGTLTQLNPDNSTYNYRTNVANSTSKGAEIMFEFNPFYAFMKKTTKISASIFTSFSYTDARYSNFRVIKKEGNLPVENNLRNNKVENAPAIIIRNGITVQHPFFSITTQFSYVSACYADANNTQQPTANAQAGIIPSYSLIDVSGNSKINRTFTLRAGVNNLTNKKYFTRRSGGYPGPGLLPSDARHYFITIGIRL